MFLNILIIPITLIINVLIIFLPLQPTKLIPPLTGKYKALVKAIQKHRTTPKYSGKAM